MSISAVSSHAPAVHHAHAKSAAPKAATPAPAPAAPTSGKGLVNIKA